MSIEQRLKAIELFRKHIFILKTPSENELKDIHKEVAIYNKSKNEFEVLDLCDFDKLLIKLGYRNPKLGKGSYGIVYKLCISESCNTQVALKKTAFTTEGFNNVYRLIDGEINTEVKIGQLLNLFVSSKITPHINMTITDLICYNQLYLFNEFSDSRDLIHYLSIKKDLDVYLILVFQIVYTLACIQKKFPSYRHNDLTTNNVLVSKVNDIGKFYIYKLNNKYYKIKGIGVQCRLWDFSLSSIDGFINNSKVIDDLMNKDNYGYYGVSTVPNKYYDLYLILKWFDVAIKDVADRSAYQQFDQFCQRNLKFDYREDVSVENNRLLSNITPITPLELIEKEYKINQTSSINGYLEFYNGDAELLPLNHTTLPFLNKKYTFDRVNILKYKNADIQKINLENKPFIKYIYDNNVNKEKYKSYSPLGTLKATVNSRYNLLKREILASKISIKDKLINSACFSDKLTDEKLKDVIMFTTQYLFNTFDFPQSISREDIVYIVAFKVICYFYRRPMINIDNLSQLSQLDTAVIIDIYNQININRQTVINFLTDKCMEKSLVYSEEKSSTEITPLTQSFILPKACPIENLRLNKWRLGNILYDKEGVIIREAFPSSSEIKSEKNDYLAISFNIKNNYDELKFKNIIRILIKLNSTDLAIKVYDAWICIDFNKDKIGTYITEKMDGDLNNFVLGTIRLNKSEIEDIYSQLNDKLNQLESLNINLNCSEKNILYKIKDNKYYFYFSDFRENDEPSNNIKKSYENCRSLITAYYYQLIYG